MIEAEDREERGKSVCVTGRTGWNAAVINGIYADLAEFKLFFVCIQAMEKVRLYKLMLFSKIPRQQQQNSRSAAAINVIYADLAQCKTFHQSLAVFAICICVLRSS